MSGEGGGRITEMRGGEGHNISLTQGKKPSEATFQVLLLNSLLDRRVDLTYYFLSYRKTSALGILINAHSMPKPMIINDFKMPSILLLNLLLCITSYYQLHERRPTTLCMYNTLINAHSTPDATLKSLTHHCFTFTSILLSGITSYITLISMKCMTRNVQQWIMKVHQCQLSFILITNSPCL